MKKLFLLTALAVVIAACGGGGDDSVASLDDSTATTLDQQAADADSEQALLDFAQCMRDNGVTDFPDPSTDSSGNLRPFGRNGNPNNLGADQATIEAASEECLPLVEDLALNFLRDNRADIEDQLFEFAACMRDEGIDMPDPDFSNLLGGGAGGGGGPFGDVDFEDPEVQAAIETCSEIFGADGGLRIPGQGRSQNDG